MLEVLQIIEHYNYVFNYKLNMYTVYLATRLTKNLNKGKTNIVFLIDSVLHFVRKVKRSTFFLHKTFVSSTRYYDKLLSKIRKFSNNYNLL